MGANNIVMNSCNYQTDDTEDNDSEDDYLDDEGGQLNFLLSPLFTFQFIVTFGIHF